MGKQEKSNQECYFFKSWKRKTPLEKRYILSLEKALEWMKEQPFIEDVLAVYVKGSFVYREINEKSDIDVVPVVKSKEALDLLREIRDKNKEWLKPVELLPLGIEELMNNEYYKEHLTEQRVNLITIIFPLIIN